MVIINICTSTYIHIIVIAAAPKEDLKVWLIFKQGQAKQRPVHALFSENVLNI